MWIISINPHDNSLGPRSLITTILQVRKQRLLRKSSEYSKVTCARTVISFHQCQPGTCALAQQPMLPENKKCVSLLLIHFLPCAMEPGTGISNIIQFIRYKSLNTVPLKFPHFYNGTRSSQTVQSSTQYSPDEVSIQDQNISDGAHLDHHLG